MFSNLNSKIALDTNRSIENIEAAPKSRGETPDTGKTNHSLVTQFK